MKTIIAPLVTVAAVLMALPTNAHELPLGDGKISAAPRTGYLFSCQQQFNPNAPGAQAGGDWISGRTWDTAKKPSVDGSVTWPSEIAVSVEGDKRIVRANNLPNHPTGVFPIARSDDAYRYDRNPNAIREQNILLSLPAMPELAMNASCVPMGMIGFTLTGAALFNAVDARGDDAPAHEMQDECGGHPERRGQYHYHNLSPCADDARDQPGGHSSLVGYALDGFGIFGTQGEGGKTMTNATLDECHGHVGEIMWDGALRSMYHYHMTAEYPYSVGCFRGRPIKTEFSSQGRPQGQRHAQGRPPQPREPGNRPLRQQQHRFGDR